MTFFFGNSKPRPPVVIKPPEPKVFRRPGESADLFNRAVRYENFLSEMFKFFPKFYQQGLETGNEFYQKGHKTGEKAFEMPGVGSYSPEFQKPRLPPKNSSDPLSKGWLTRGHHVQGFLDGGYGERYGDTHQVSVDNKYWGYGIGETAQNINFSPSATAFDHFEDLDPLDSNTPIDASLYANLLWEPGTAPSLGNISQSSLAAAKAFIDSIPNLKDKSYYDIALTGIANSKIEGAYGKSDANKDGVADPDEQNIYRITRTEGDPNKYEVVHNGGFLYDVLDHAGAFNLMVLMLESRRRIFYAMSDVYGSPYNIGDSTAMRSHIQNTFTNPNKLGGLKPRNARPFGMFFGAQHAFRGMLPAYSGGNELKLKGKENLNHFSRADTGDVGFVNTAKDIAAFQRFRHWLHDNVPSYINGIGDKDEKANAQALWNEFVFSNDYNQPYSKTGDVKGFTGWDCFAPKWGNGEKPFGLSPTALGQDHPYYAVSQLVNLTRAQISGKENIQGQNLNQDNWAVYAFSWQMKWDEGTYQENFLATVMQSMERSRFRKETKKVSEVKAKKKEDEAEELKNDGKARSAREADNKGGENNANNRKGEFMKGVKDYRLSKAEMQRALQMQFLQMQRRRMSMRKKEMDKMRNNTKGKKEA